MPKLNDFETIRNRFYLLLALILAVVVGFGNGARWARSQALVGADCWERKPMPFCELMGPPINGRLALLPEGVGPHD